ncbi:uncharacterized protein LOC111463263 [Cucurbita moschata]|uniref:Uncharacterized protein LOC111463263 n=1 Tax=Cucurbita moschata TaxID=3662 RepID=A0A6J1HHB9_CUCMO|nr:uncharacterized protein LOC111463263 [Cucurbita moschata]
MASSFTQSSGNLVEMKTKQTECHYMDITVPGKNVSEEVTRESLIAISYSEPESALSSKRPSGKLNSKNLNLVEGKEFDADEKYRSELISISFLESPPEIGSVPVGKLKG